jgi:3'(2'), 5'-bisphosphate nucleotidase
MLELTEPKTALLLSVLRDAAALGRAVRAETKPAGLTKEDLSPVTVADFAIQAMAGRRLRDAFPSIPLVAEEDSAGLRTAGGVAVLEAVTGHVSRCEPDATPEAVCEWIDVGRALPGDVFWTLDPIDGTKGFLRGGQYAVALALVERGVAVLGGLACPGLAPDGTPGTGMIALARRGEGAWSVPLDDPGAAWRRLRVSTCSDPTQARMMRSFEAGHTNMGQTDAIARMMGINTEPVPMDSQAKYAALAAGRAEMQIRLLSPSQPDYKEKIWDHAAGTLVLEEAGGCVTDLRGAPLDFTHGRSLTANTGLLATNGAVHGPALAAVRRVLEGD